MADPAGLRTPCTRLCRARTCSNTSSAIWASSPSRENSGSLRLQLRPAIVSQTALGGLLYWMHDRAIERVLISALDEEWSHELVASRDEAVRRLLARVRFSPADREGDFLSRPRPLHQLQRSSPLRAALDAWSASPGQIRPRA